jgi:hypothetical protein
VARHCCFAYSRPGIFVFVASEGIALSHSEDNHETLTFVVRLWHETDTEGHARWRGRVEHVASQEVGYVEDVTGVASFIERWTREPATARTVTAGS